MWNLQTVKNEICPFSPYIAVPDCGRLPILRRITDNLIFGGQEIMTDVEYILDFAAGLGSRMMTAGANLERVNDTLNRICRSYGLTDISIFSLSSIIQISARSQEGEYGYRQVPVSAKEFHLEKVTRFNQLSRTVCQEKPDPVSLMGMLETAETVQGYPGWLRLAGRLLAMSSLCVMFGGTAGDVLASDLIILLLSWMIQFFSSRNINHIVVNMICMFFSSLAGILLVLAGIGENYFVIAITCSMRLIPGIALVDAARNLLCGNEMNGILETLKAVLETFAIVLGQVAGLYLLGGLIAW